MDDRNAFSRPGRAVRQVNTRAAKVVNIITMGQLGEAVKRGTQQAIKAALTPERLRQLQPPAPAAAPRPKPHEQARLSLGQRDVPRGEFGEW